MQRRSTIDDILLRSGDICDQVAKLCEIAPKFRCFWAAKFRGKGPPKFLTEFNKSGTPSNMWQSSVTIGQATSEIRRRKKERRTTGQNIMAGGQHSWRAAIISAGTYRTVPVQIKSHDCKIVNSDVIDRIYWKQTWQPRF